MTPFTITHRGRASYYDWSVNLNKVCVALSHMCDSSPHSVNSCSIALFSMNIYLGNGDHKHMGIPQK